MNLVLMSGYWIGEGENSNQAAARVNPEYMTTHLHMG